MEQRTDEWFACRLGKATASRMHDITATTRSGWGASRRNYAAELVAERLTGIPANSYMNAAMQWGIDNEADAIAAYEASRKTEVMPVGFVDHPEIPMSGASPDGLVGDDGLVEIKCPNVATHIEYMLGGAIPDKYFKQMAWQLACTGRSWCDFASYDPRMPAHMQLYVVRYQPTREEIMDLEDQVTVFLGEVDKTVSELMARFDNFPSLED